MPKILLPSGRRRRIARHLFPPALFLILFFLSQPVTAQPAPYSTQEIQGFVQAFKTDPRGPFQGIRWFCPDGSVISPQDRCPQPGGIQHALLKDVVVQIQQRNGIYIGQILAGTDISAFLDIQHDNARLKQYMIERYLASADDGWIFRLAQYYRGAYQAEDEERWGQEFLTWMSSRDDMVASRYFLLREAVRTIPHTAANNTLEQVRILAKELADEYAPFMDLRIKIHGQPEASDTSSVKSFIAGHNARLTQAQRQKFEQLRRAITAYYRTDPMVRVRQIASRLPAGSQTARQVTALEQLPRDPARRMHLLSRLLYTTRSDIADTGTPADRLRMLDLSLEVEALVFRTAAAWKPASPHGNWIKAQYLLQAAVGAGFIEEWEWDTLQPVLNTDTQDLTIETYGSMVESVKRAVEWSVGMATAVYGSEVARFSAFEPLASSFIDERLRSSLMLPLGEVSGELSLHYAQASGIQNEVLGLGDAGGIRGINPGVAVGRLVVVDGVQEASDFQSDAIYVMARTPAELKPVAGIATVSEGNMVSHVQLLARNLGIPNAVLTPELMRELRAFSGQQVFYAVSPRGVVRMKPAQRMTEEERLLIEERKRAETRIRVPTDRLNMRNTRLTPLFELRANDSGVVCGPKAANLGQLSSLFPGQVAPGFIVPFGIFRDHMEQPMPGSTQTYWGFLQESFSTAERMRARGESEERVDEFMLEQLAALRAAIEKMPLQAEFVADLRRTFTQQFGAALGETAVFVRSDTNMEDLKDFTGAGLNLTVPNVRSEEAILQGIRNVWASPYRERGYRWRQKYLLNPEEVYPSLLILRSVNVDKSGVIITTGVSSGNEDDFTFAFNRGVGGAVDGQAAETYEVAASRFKLISPAREPAYTTLPVQGGTSKRFTSFENRILSPQDLVALRDIAEQIRRKLPGTPGIETNGPFDVELGLLDGRIYLFQARPFVQNRAAGAMSYLTALERNLERNRSINLDAERD